jgi:hypothetical protein
MAKQSVPQTKRIRVLTASATRLNLRNNAEVARLRAVRQDWQLDSFTFRATIGEIRFAVNFLANCAARMRVYVAALPLNMPSDMPQEITDVKDCPPEILDACENAMRDLGNGRIAMSSIMKSLSTNMSLPGEAFLLGQTDKTTGVNTYSIRSVSEIVVYNNETMLRESPTDSSGTLGLTKLDMDFTFISRMWQEDPEYRLLADSPMKAIQNECEALLILRRMIRATGRSRLAGRGILAVPDEVSIVSNNDNNEDPLSDPFMEDLADAMMTPIENEGDASAVVPIVMRGPGEHLDKIRLIELGGIFDAEARANRDELVGVIATTLDLPKEVIQGIADLNHWSAWQVDDNTFRHHVEPHVQVLVSCLTSAFLRPYIETTNLPDNVKAAWIPRLMFWYDATELVTHPDRMANATALHDAIVISDEAYRNVGGFTDEDAPSATEIELRMIRTMRQWPANVVMALLHALDPALAVLPMTGPPALPGIDSTGVVAPIAPTATTSNEDTSVSSEPLETTAPTNEGPPIPSGMTSSDDDASITASMILQSLNADGRRELLASLRRHVAPKKPTPSAKSIELSRKMTMIDRDLRARLTVLCNNEMLHHLGKAGAKMRAKVAKNESLRKKIAMTRNEHVLAVLGLDTITASGLTASGLMQNDWESLHEQYLAMTQQAQEQALKIATQLGGLDESAAQETAQYFGSSSAAGWSVLKDSMNSLAVNLPNTTNPNMTSDELIDALNPDTMVPTGVVRASLAVAGGTAAQDLGTIVTKSGAEVAAIPLGIPVGGIATGATIKNLLTSNGATHYSYQWEHGPSVNVFQPHDDLNGYTFTSFTDDGLANTTDFPNNSYYLPGDHLGCLCDVTPLWVSAQDVQDAIGNSMIDDSFEPTDEDLAEAAQGAQAAKTAQILAQIDKEMPNAIANAKESVTSFVNTKVGLLSTKTFGSSGVSEAELADNELNNNLGLMHKWVNGIGSPVGIEAESEDYAKIRDAVNYLGTSNPTLYRGVRQVGDALEKDQKAHETRDLVSWTTDFDKAKAFAGNWGTVRTLPADTVKALDVSKYSPFPNAAQDEHEFIVDMKSVDFSKMKSADVADAKPYVANPFSYKNMYERQKLEGFKDVQTYKMITQPQQQQLKTWTGPSHKRMNAALRFNQYPVGASDATKKVLDAENRRLALAIRSQPRTTDEMIVQRQGWLPQGIKVGETFTDKGFVATAKLDGQFQAGDGVKMMISLPKGTQGLDVNKSFKAFNMTNRFSHEKEFLLPPNSRFRVESIDAHGTVTLTHLPKTSREKKT